MGAGAGRAAWEVSVRTACGGASRALRQPGILIKRDSQSVVLSVSAGVGALWPRIGRTAKQPHWHHRCLRCNSYDCRHCQHLQQALGALEDAGDVVDGLEEYSFRPQGWAPPS